MIVTVVVAFVIIVIFVYILLPDSRHKKLMATVPGPRCVPVFGNTLMLRSGHAWFLQLLELAEKYYEQGVFRLWLANKPMCAIYKPEYVEALLNSTIHIDKSEQYNYLHIWLGTGLLTSTGNKWRHRRKMLTPTFHFNILHDFVNVFNQQSHVLVSTLKSKSSKGQFDVFQDIAHCALDIICETAMGKSINAQSTDSEYVGAVYRMSFLLDNRMRKPWLWPDFLYNIIGYGTEQSQKLNILHNFTNSVIADRLKNFDQKTAKLIEQELKGEISDEYTGRKNKRMAFLDMLLYMSDNLTKLSMEDIREEVDTFMFEGHDTTAAAMTWTVHLIGANPEVQIKVHEELDSVFGDDDRDATMEDLNNLKYLQCCIKESLRLYPSVPMFGRKLSEDMQLGSHTIPKGISVVLLTSAMHRDPEIFPEPEVFKPERFFLENSKKRHPYSYIPFSAGSRNCIGQKFAVLEEKTVLSHIFRQFSVKSTQKRSDLRPVGDLILRPDTGILIEVTPRCHTK